MEVISINVAGNASSSARGELCTARSKANFVKVRTGRSLRLWALPARRVVGSSSAPSLVRGKRVVEPAAAPTRRSRAPPCYSARQARSRRTAPSIVALARAHCAAAQLRFGEPCDAAPGATADLVLGSELLYYNTDLDALVSTIAEQLTIDGVCVLCVVHRVHGGAAALAASAASMALWRSTRLRTTTRTSSTRRACTSCAAPAAWSPCLIPRRYLYPSCPIRMTTTTRPPPPEGASAAVLRGGRRRPRASTTWMSDCRPPGLHGHRLLSHGIFGILNPPESSSPRPPECSAARAICQRVGESSSRSKTSQSSASIDAARRRASF